jgi:excisionase family DNA binding protein
VSTAGEKNAVNRAGGMTDVEHAVNVSAMAEILGVSLNTLYRKAALGEVPGVRVGRRWLFYPSVVKDVLNRPDDPWMYPAASRNARRKTA